MSSAPPINPPPKSPPKPAPPPPSGAKLPGASIGKKFAVQSGVRSEFQRVVLYGPGGVGKTELCANLIAVGIRPLFLDIGTGTGFLNVDRISDITTWDDLRGALHDESLWSGFGAVVIDDLTKAEELAVKWTLANVPHEKGNTVQSIEGYGFGKGLTHVYETFLQILGDLDAHVRAARQVICIAHDCTANVPNPSGEDFIRWEPRLQSPASGKNSIRHRVKEWCDHMLFIGYDTFVNEKTGKAMGGGSRTIFPAEMPTHWAKSRCLADPIIYTRGSAELWQKLFTKG